MLARKYCSFDEITIPDVENLANEIQKFAAKYEKMNAAALLSKRDTSLTPLANIKLGTLSPAKAKLAYYELLRKLDDSLKTVRYPKNEIVVHLRKILLRALTTIKEAKLDPESISIDEAETEEALFELFKSTHTLRTRSFIDENYLQSLVDEIKEETHLYRQSIDQTLNGAEKDTLEQLEKINLLVASTDSPLTQYHQILSKLFEAIKPVIDKNISHINNLHQLLALELQTQKESNWLPRLTTKVDLHAITLALSNIKQHTEFSSQEDEDYAEKWGIIASDFVNQRNHSLWTEMCNQQGWHIGDNHCPEVVCAAQFLLGIKPDANAIHIANTDSSPARVTLQLHQDCYALSKGDKKIASLEKEISEIKRIITLRNDIETLENKIEHAHKHTSRTSKEDVSTSKLETDLAAKRKALNKLNTDIIDAEESLESKQQELLRYKTQLAKEELHHLNENREQLKLWTVRNLNILFMENILDGQIKRLENPLLDVTTDELSQNFEKMVKRLANSYRKILEALSDAEDLLHDEYVQIGNLIDLGSRSIVIPQFERIDPASSAKSLEEYVLSHLSEYTLASQYQEVKKQCSYVNFERGIQFPAKEDVLKACETTNHPSLPTSPPPTFVRQRVLRQLPVIAPLEIEAAATPTNSLAYNLLIGLLIGIAFALVAAAIAAAIVFTCGAALAVLTTGFALSYATTLSTAAIGGLFGGIAGGGILAGLFGGLLYSRHTAAKPKQQPSFQLGTTAQTNASFALEPSQAKSAVKALPVKQLEDNDIINPQPSTTSQPLEVSPSVRNLQTRPA